MPGRSIPSLFRRTLLFLGLLVGFYVLALGLAVALLALPVVLYQVSGRLHFDIAIACVLAAGAILIGLSPGEQGELDPGPSLTRGHHPRFFGLLDELATATGQPVPDAVFLVASTTAWVTQHGGTFGFGSRRILAIGLPVLAALNASELRAVLAHEYAHFMGGETRLGGLLHRTRSAMEQTLFRLERAGPFTALLQRPLRAYARFFLRRTLAISRAQEWAADRVAADVAGRRAFTSGLLKIQVIDSAFDGFLAEELNPILVERVLPPIVEGFRSFLEGPLIRDRYERALADLVEANRSGVAKLAPTAGQYDSHPWLHERVDALASLPEGQPPPADGPAHRLLDDWPRLERAICARMIPDAPRFPAIAWDAVGEQVLVPSYRKRLAKVADLFQGSTIGEAGASLRDRAFPLGLAWSNRVADTAATGDPEEIAGRGAISLAYAVTATLAGRGWRIRSLPGEHVTAIGPTGEFAVLEEFRALDLGRKDAGPWVKRCGELGIADWPLDITEP